MDVNRAKSLLQKYQQGRCTQEERNLVESVFDAVVDPDIQDAENPDLYTYRDGMWQNLSQKLSIEIFEAPTDHPGNDTHPRVRRMVNRFVPYAAAVMMLLTIGWLIWHLGYNGSEKNISMTEILPGGNRATLTLADGRTIDLSEAKAGIVVADGITYLDGTAVIENEKLNKENEKPAFNSITTPKGGTYQITLPDGSKVWLNAASTLRYPSRFAADTREVFLEGEAFFSVSRTYLTGMRQPSETNRRLTAGRLPFRVVTTGQTVEVLGTEFNISAYPDEPETKTTLVEGAVQVINLTSSIVNQLQPGEQSIIRGATNEKRNIDVAQYTAWKNGYFAFDNAPLHDVLKDFERWYDIEIHYEGNIPDDRFNGEISRILTLQQVLDGLATTRINYRVEGKTLTIIGN